MIMMESYWVGGPQREQIRNGKRILIFKNISRIPEISSRIVCSNNPVNSTDPSGLYISLERDILERDFLSSGTGYDRTDYQRYYSFVRNGFYEFIMRSIVELEYGNFGGSETKKVLKCAREKLVAKSVKFEVKDEATIDQGVITTQDALYYPFKDDIYLKVRRVEDEPSWKSENAEVFQGGDLTSSQRMSRYLYRSGAYFFDKKYTIESFFHEALHAYNHSKIGWGYRSSHEEEADAFVFGRAAAVQLKYAGTMKWYADTLNNTRETYRDLSSNPEYRRISDEMNISK